MTTATPPPAGPGVVGRRVVQYLLDLLFVGLPALALAVAAIVLLRPDEPQEVFPFVRNVFLVMFVADILSLWLLTAWWPYRHRGQTPAMRLLGLRIVGVDGGQPPLRAFVVRQLLLLVDGFAWGLVGLVIMLVTPRRQRLGDLVARTVVVRARSADQAAFPGPDRDLGAVTRP